MARSQNEKMQFTKTRHLIGAALVAAVVAYFGARMGYGGLPPLPTFAGATLLLIAVVNGALAVTLRPRVQHRPGTEPVDSLTAARAVALAKASSIAGALMGGVWLGLLAFLLPLLNIVEAARSDSASSLVGLISAAALTGTGLWLEYTLRNPDEPEEPEDDE